MDASTITRYAELVVRVGAAVRDDSTVYVTADVEHLPLVRAITEQAYRAGAFRVVVDLADSGVRRAALDHAPLESLESHEPWLEALLPYLRAKRTDSPTFRRLTEELVTLLAYEATRDVRVEPFEIATDQ